MIYKPLHFSIKKEDHPNLNTFDKLMDHAMEHAKEHGCNRINLVAVCEEYWFFKSWYQDASEVVSI